MPSGWIELSYSKSRVKSAGEMIRKDTADKTDWDVFENWRKAHAYVLNTFQMRLRSARSRFDGDIQIAQRHKRRPTIVDKLTREPSMQLSTMHDIAGCRAICSNVEELYAFRNFFLQTRAKHKRVNQNEKFDYIKNPKKSGYRGIHDVFETVLESDSGKKWDGLKVEIQFRTRAQHAWATAVETIDLLNGERAKFGQAEEQIQRFFVVSSELIARVVEERNGPLAESSNIDISREFDQLDGSLGIISRLSNAASSNPVISKGKNTILIFHYGDPQKLDVKSFESITPAQEAYTELEQQMDGKADVVLVKSEHADDLKRAFQNYFTDARDFVELVKKAREKIR